MPEHDGERERERAAEQVWRSVQVDWAEEGWRRLEETTRREPVLGSVMAGVLLACTCLVGASVMADLSPGWSVALVIPVFLLSLYFAGWAVLPWMVSTDRRRAILPVGVLVLGTATSFAGGWWLLPGVGTIAVAAGLGVRELRLIGRDLAMDRLKG